MASRIWWKHPVCLAFSHDFQRLASGPPKGITANTHDEGLVGPGDEALLPSLNGEPLHLLSRQNENCCSPWNRLELPSALGYSPLPGEIRLISRIDAAGAAIHHVMVRGIERVAVFRSDSDRDHFLERLGETIQDTQTPCYAWALIPNNFHHLLRTWTVPASAPWPTRFGAEGSFLSKR